MDIRGYLEATWADYADKLLREVDARLDSAVGGIKRGGKLNAATLTAGIDGAKLTAGTVPAAALAADIKPAILDVPTITGLLTLSDGQIEFPSTQSASADPNTLDDYEEGTWTPVPTNLTVTGTVYYSGTYVKIGKMVFIGLTVSGAVTGDSSQSTGNSTYFSGLPFAPSLTEPVYGIGFSGTDMAIGFVHQSSRLYTPTYAATLLVTFRGFYLIS